MGKVEYKPQGFRDVYWCPSLNEPFVIEYITGTDKRYCPLCKTQEFDEGHEFIAHILKPIS